MKSAIPRIERRIAELKSLDHRVILNRQNPELIKVQTALEQFRLSTFGIGTIEYAKYKMLVEVDASVRHAAETTPELQAGVMKGRDRSIAILEQIKSHFEEEIEDSEGAAAASVLRAYNDLQLHAEIDRAASDLYRDGHYANAVEDAVKALNDLVRLRSGLGEDGDSLMRKAFSPNSPVLAFNALADESDRSEQRGFMDMFAGAVAGLRNPRAHKIVKDDPERALEFIAFVSLLAKLCDEAKKVRKP